MSDESRHALERPEPLYDVASRVAGWRAALALIVTAAATFGLIDPAQASALDVVIASAAPLVTAILAALSAFKVAQRGRELVTPLSEPLAADGTRLVSEATARARVAAAISARPERRAAARSEAGEGEEYPPNPWFATD